MQPLSKADLVRRHDGCTDIDRHFRFVRRLGSGSFGTVDLLHHRRTGAERVAKTVNIKGMKPATLALMTKEIDLLRELDHPRVVKLYEYAEDVRRSTLLLVMEYLPGGDLDSLIKDGQLPEESVVARLFEQVLSATAYCHARGICHSDMKPDNIILTGPVPQGCTGWLGEPLDCKVIDFGLAAHFSRSSPDSITQVAGTPAFIAPEVIKALRGGSFGPKADVWSIGVIAFNLLTGELPFGHHREHSGDFWPVFRSIEAFEGVDLGADLWDDASESACEFVDELMCPDPGGRPSAKEALQLSFFEEHISVQHKKIRRRILRSLRDFAHAPALVKVCLLLIASRVEAKRLRRCRRAFTRLDVDCSGVVSREELDTAVSNPGGFFPCCCYPQVDVDEIFDEVNLSQSGAIEYTEFAAACLYPKLRSQTGKELIYAAFFALDDDGDGLITADAVLSFFSHKGREELRLLDGLPKDRCFDQEEFYQCLIEQAKTCQSSPKQTSIFCGIMSCSVNEELDEH